MKELRGWEDESFHYSILSHGDSSPSLGEALHAPVDAQIKCTWLPGGWE